MSGGADLVFYALVLILPVSALVARRLPLGETLKMALAWVAIFVVAFALVELWQGAVMTGSTLGSLIQ